MNIHEARAALAGSIATQCGRLARLLELRRLQVLPRFRSVLSHRYAAGLGLFAGMALLVTIFLEQDMSRVWEAVRSVRWGLIPLIALHLVPMALDGLAWRIIVPLSHRPSKSDAIYLRWIGEAVSGFLPGAYVGGELVRIRLAGFRGCPTSVAALIAMVDLMLGAAVQCALLATGLIAVVLATLFQLGWVSGFLLISFVVIGLGLCAWLQDRHMLLAVNAWRRLGLNLRARAYKHSAQRVRAVSRSLREFVASKPSVGLSVAMRISSWIIAVMEVWLGLLLLGQPVTIADAFVLELITQTARTLAFFIPAGLGVQEGILMLASGSLAISLENALALSLLKRSRDIVLGLPALLAWQADEGRHWWRLQTRPS